MVKNLLEVEAGCSTKSTTRYLGFAKKVSTYLAPDTYSNDDKDDAIVLFLLLPVRLVLIKVIH